MTKTKSSQTKHDLLRKAFPAESMVDEDELIEDLDEAEEVIEVPYSITSYGADYPVDSLMKRLEANDVFVPTFNMTRKGGDGIVGFQRQYVWPRPKADRFIESLLLGLPVPGIFLVKEESVFSSCWTVTSGFRRCDRITTGK